MWIVIRENIKIALDSIRGQLLRTILTVLIIAIGITALVGILSVITALRNTLEGNFSSMGANTFSITRYQYTQRAEGSGTTQNLILISLIKRQLLSKNSSIVRLPKQVFL